MRQRAEIQKGIPQDKAKEIVKFIKDSKAKVQSSIQGDVVRVTGRDRDTLQDIISRVKGQGFRYSYGVHQLSFELTAKGKFSLFSVRSNRTMRPR